MRPHGFHVFWSKPYALLKAEQRRLPDHEVLLTMLSALKWRQWNGPVSLFTDDHGLKLFQDAGITWIWDTIDTTLLSQLSARPIDPAVFWSAAKMLVLEVLPSPCASIDTDMIVWEDLSPHFNGRDLMFTHYERTSSPYWYPSLQNLGRPQGYSPPPDWDWSLPAANTSLIYFGSEAFKSAYVDEYNRYCHNNAPSAAAHTLGNPLVLFADQRLLVLCAGHTQASFAPLIHATWIPEEARFEFTKDDPVWNHARIARDNFLTHAWIYKDVLKRDDAIRFRYCTELARELVEASPSAEAMLQESARFQPYLCML